MGDRATQPHQPLGKHAASTNADGPPACGPGLLWVRGGQDRAHPPYPHQHPDRPARGAGGAKTKCLPMKRHVRAACSRTCKPRVFVGSSAQRCYSAPPVTKIRRKTRRPGRTGDLPCREGRPYIYREPGRGSTRSTVHRHVRFSVVPRCTLVHFGRDVVPRRRHSLAKRALRQIVARSCVAARHDRSRCNANYARIISASTDRG